MLYCSLVCLISHGQLLCVAALTKCDGRRFSGLFYVVASSSNHDACALPAPPLSIYCISISAKDTNNKKTGSFFVGCRHPLHLEAFSRLFFVACKQPANHDGNHQFPLVLAYTVKYVKRNRVPAHSNHCLCAHPMRRQHRLVQSVALHSADSYFHTSSL